MGFTKEEAMQTPSVWVGIDISKAQLDMAVEPGGDSLTVPYDGPGLGTLITRLSRLVRLWKLSTVMLELNSNRPTADRLKPIFAF